MNNLYGKALKIRFQVECSCIAAAFLAGNLQFFEFPKDLPKMQLQCSCNAIYLHFLHKINDF